MSSSTHDHIMDILLSSNPVMGIITHSGLFPFVYFEMRGVQHVHMHAEGDVWQHTKLTINNMLAQENHDWLDILIALVHDIGKMEALEINHGQNMAGHDMLGVPKFDAWQKLFMPGLPQDIVDTVEYCISMHMKAHNLAQMRSDYDIMELVTGKHFPRLARLARADSKSCLGVDGEPMHDFDQEVLDNSRVKRWIGQPPVAPVVSQYELTAAGVPEQLHPFGMNYCLKMQVNGNVTKRDSLVSALLKDEGYTRLLRGLSA